MLQKNSAFHSSIVPIQPKGLKFPLFGIHVLGKGMRFYRPLAKHLGAEHPLYGLAVQMTVGDIHLNTVEALAAHYIQQMQMIQPRGPYHLIGVSLGGIIAFEMAQQLYIQGQEVALLGMLDTFAPSGVVKALPLRSRLLDVWNYLGQPKSIDALSEAKSWFLEWTLKHDALQAGYEGFYSMLNRPLPDSLQDLLYIKQNQKILSKYTPQVYPGEVVVFQARDQQVSSAFASDPRLCWNDLAAKGIKIHEIPGDHLGILQEPHVRVLAEKIKLYLNPT
ncbi:hypothetical protein K9N68_00650 [Kovacikia minuta CCNUW1]|uniref:thioesterase domain-containing protein n=1 Tax=Kovacikia minuta TaxID=2931930 RepID=UPI001CCA8EE8|nr:thioesterase domain-containing protein [Kovacikia minuta]UBF26558.1 hypothetical protein K9N68_00650 [Kovacikia minuta CCNUW1]